MSSSMTATRRASNLLSQLTLSTILLVVICGVLGECATGIAKFEGRADIVDLAVQIESGLPAETAYLSQFIKAYGLDHPSADCSDTLTRAALTINLAALEAAVADKEVAGIKAAASRALEFAKQRLVCNPLDGNGWLRYATVTARLNGPVPEAIDALRMSYRTAPNEGWILEARLRFATNVYLAGIDSLEQDFIGDLHRFVSFEPTDQVGQNYVQADPRIQKLLHPLIAAEPDERKKEILAAIDAAGVVFEPK